MTDITVCFPEKKLILKSEFAKKAARCGSAESATLQRYVMLYPNFDITIHSIRKNASQEHFKGLTYDYMRSYICSHESKENASAVLEALEEMINISHCHSQCKRYPVIKKWFLDRYPEVREFGVADEETEDTEAVPLEAAA